MLNNDFLGSQSRVEHAAVHGHQPAASEELQPRLDVGGPELRRGGGRARDSGCAIQDTRNSRSLPR